MNNKELIDKFSKIYKGTTTVGIKCKDGIIVATDRRVTSGFYIAHKRGRKIQKITDYIVATIAGAVGDAQKIVDNLRAEARIYELDTSKHIKVKSLATLASTLLFNARPFVFIVQMIIGGIDEKGASLFNIDWFGSVTNEKYIATGSGSPMALGVLETAYNEDITVRDAVPFAIKAVYAATRLDPGSGEGIDVTMVTKEGIKNLSDSLIRKYI